MKRYLKALWRLTFEPIYRRLFRRYFEAILREVQANRADLYNHIDGINTRQGRVNAEVIAGLADLDRHVRTVIAAGWDDTALSRRMAALEDRLDRAGAPIVPESEEADQK
jgi:hypothetical protein